MVNILLNPDFEAGLANWIPVVWFAEEPYDIAFGVSADAYAGSQSAIIRYNSLSTEAMAVLYQDLDVAKIKVNQPMTLSIAYKTVLPYCKFYVNFFDANWNIIKEVGVDLFENDGAWHTATITGNAPPNFVYAQVYCKSWCNPQFCPATVQFDSASVEVVEPPPDDHEPPPEIPWAPIAVAATIITVIAIGVGYYLHTRKQP